MHCFIKSPSRKVVGQIFQQLHWIGLCLELPWDSLNNDSGREDWCEMGIGWKWYCSQMAQQLYESSPKRSLSTWLGHAAGASTKSRKEGLKTNAKPLMPSKWKINHHHCP